MTAIKDVMQGTYKRENIIKEKADSGEKICVRVSDKLSSAMVSDNMDNVPIMDSFAENPVITEDTARQSPNPRGSKTGARNFPISASMLVPDDSALFMWESKF